MADLAVTNDGKTGYAAYRKNAALGRWEQKAEAKGDILMMPPGSLYALDILMSDSKGDSLYRPIAYP